MAWTNTNTVVCMTPFLIRRISVTPDDTTATAITHGEPMSPTFVIPVCTDTSNPTAGMFAVARDTSATTLTVDVTAAETFDLICIWVPQARTDGQSITQDNNT